MSWELEIGGIHLVNASGTPTPGGDPFSAATTCFGVRYGYMPKSDEREETIPIVCVGTSQPNAAARMLQLKRALKKAKHTAPAPYRWQPEGAMESAYSEVYTGVAEEFGSRADNPLGAEVGGYDLEGEIRLERAGFFGSAALQVLAAAAPVTNTHTGNLVSLSPLRGEFDQEGQPLNITFSKPAGMAAVGLYLASAFSRTPVTLNESKTATNLTGTAYTASPAIDLSAMRTRSALRLRLMARLKTLTNPANGQLQITVKANGGATLWSTPFVQLGSDTTAQLLDMTGADLTMLRTPLANTSMVTLHATLRSLSGSVTALLDYVEAILYYDESFCKIESTSGLAAGQKYQLFGAQNRSGGGWLPINDELCQVVDSADMPLAPAVSRPRLIKAYTDASLYVAWVDANNAHTHTDTSTITVLHAPLWSTLQA